LCDLTLLFTTKNAKDIATRLDTEEQAIKAEKKATKDSPLKGSSSYTNKQKLTEKKDALKERIEVYKLVKEAYQTAQKTHHKSRHIPKQVEELGIVPVPDYFID
jgi:predicted ribosome quality control (RQC) complex YloA/Tae2 family protein